MANRLTLGEQFSEAARLAWVELAERNWTLADLSRKIQTTAGKPISSGYTSRILYGDRTPGTWLSLQFENVLGISPALWFVSPTEHFEPPAVAEARAALADIPPSPEAA